MLKMRVERNRGVKFVEDRSLGKNVEIRLLVMIREGVKNVCRRD